MLHLGWGSETSKQCHCCVWGLPSPTWSCSCFQGWIQEVFLGWGGCSWGLIRGLDFSF